MTIEDKTLTNNELTKLIGHRLRDAVGRGAGNTLPAAIDEGLAALRQAEARLRGARDPIIDIENSSASDADGGAGR